MASEKTTNPANRLALEKSPYLLQHANNPVDWYPWGEEAFALAQKEDRPIFLSIGYSTCHWCHVMAHESFEDAGVARLMNQAFVCIKVDREERPDIDAVYMTVAQMTNGSGGWPLNIVMTPQKKPFFTATYIPKENRFGHIGMIDLIGKLSQIWTSRRQEVIDSAEKVAEALRSLSQKSPGHELSARLLGLAYEQLSQQFDAEHGGFAVAPKFPTPHNLSFLLRYWKSTGNKKALRMVETTLQKMRLGGIYDHVGFGFHRYSTDNEWLVPHFEKMLYDQAMLAIAYVEAFQATGKTEYQATASEIFTYVLREMTSPEGGFYSAEDADSEGVEGKFYVWKADEIRQVLEEDADLFMELFNVRPEGNFADEATGKQTSENIVHLKKSLGELADEHGMDPGELVRRIEAARAKLFDHRRKRIHPHKDDKILADWNGLMIAALAKGAQAFGEPRYAQAAQKATDFILEKMMGSDGRLLHRYRQGEAAQPAFADDYAFLIWGLLDLYEATFDIRYFQKALDINADFMERFWDERYGGFYATPVDGESLLVRQKEIYDGAVPSANSVAMMNLIRLSRMTGQTVFESKAEKLGKAFSEMANKIPVGFTQLMCSLDFSLGPTHEIVIAGNLKSEDTQTMLRLLQTRFLPNKVVLFNPGGEASPQIHQLAEFTRYQPTIDDKSTAYVCLSYNCKQPTTDAGEMLALLVSDSD